MGIECHPLTGTLGAEVAGADFANPTDSMIDELKKIMHVMNVEGDLNLLEPFVQFVD